jgi:hypothetical protein
MRGYGQGSCARGDLHEGFSLQLLTVVVSDPPGSDTIVQGQIERFLQRTRATHLTVIFWAVAATQTA